MKEPVRFIIIPLFLFALLAQPLIYGSASGSENKFGIGFKVGVNKLEGDWREPSINPQGAFVLHYRPIPYFGMGTEIGYSFLKTQSDAVRMHPSLTNSDDYITIALPVELNVQFNFFPFARISPFAQFGLGALWWNSQYDGATLTRGDNEQKYVDLSVKAAGGIEYDFQNGLALSLGMDYRYSSTDLLDQIPNGDEQDGIVSVWTGLNYYFVRGSSSDTDGDEIPDELDLDLRRAEDRNGYFDHDGQPEGHISGNQDDDAPIVIHYPVFKAEEGKDLLIRAEITSIVPLRVAALLYRKRGSSNWNVSKLQLTEGLEFVATIPGEFVTKDGLEYCVVAIDQQVRGIGYSGLPKRPIRVNVVSSGYTWRAIGTAAAALGWGAAAFIGLRKQNF